VVDGRRGGWGRHCPLLFHVVVFQNPLRPRRSGEAYGTGSITADDRDSKSIPSPERKDELVSHQYLHLQTLAIGTRSSSDMFVVRGWM